MTSDKPGENFSPIFEINKKSYKFLDKWFHSNHFPAKVERSFDKLAKNYSLKVQKYSKTEIFPVFHHNISLVTLNAIAATLYKHMESQKALLTNQPWCFRWKFGSISKQNLPSWKSLNLNVFPHRQNAVSTTLFKLSR